MAAIRKIPLRLVIYPKDVENITGRRDRTARKLLQKIREALGKQTTNLSPSKNSVSSPASMKSW
jgi:hypothetical protein